VGGGGGSCSEEVWKMLERSHRNEEASKAWSFFRFLLFMLVLPSIVLVPCPLFFIHDITIRRTLMAFSPYRTASPQLNDRSAAVIPKAPSLLRYRTYFTISSSRTSIRHFLSPQYADEISSTTPPPADIKGDIRIGKRTGRG
jgi:hypothetical protein